MNISEELKYQLSVLEEDKRKTTEKLWQIQGAIKIVDHFMKKVEADSGNLTTEDIPVQAVNNGAH